MLKALFVNRESHYELNFGARLESGDLQLIYKQQHAQKERERGNTVLRVPFFYL